MDAKHDAFNAKHYGHLIQANELLGLRKSELRDIRKSSFSFQKGEGSFGEKGITLLNCDRMVVTTKGKGGRINQRTYVDPGQISQLQAMIQDKKPGERIFDKSQFKADSGDLHQSRGVSLQNLYKQVVSDIENRAGARNEYIAAINSAFAAAGKPMRENLDRHYVLRGEHRTYCEKNGIPTTFNRVAALYTSCQAGHLRTDVTVGHYLAK